MTPFMRIYHPPYRDEGGFYSTKEYIVRVEDVQFGYVISDRVYRFKKKIDAHKFFNNHERKTYIPNLCAYLQSECGVDYAGSF